MYYRGVMTLTLLVFLSGALIILMLLNDDMLRLYQTLSVYRQHYVQNQGQLQKKVRSEWGKFCGQLPLNSQEDIIRIAFHSPQENDGISHFLWCQRQSVLKSAPKKALMVGRFAEYVHPQAKMLPFQYALQPPSPIWSADSQAKLFWFPQEQTNWHIEGNVDALIIAEGDLHLTGKGRIRGSIITKGRFTYDKAIKITYRKAVVESLIKQYSVWQQVEKSWHDFEPL